MKFLAFGTAVIAFLLSPPIASAQQAVTIDGNDITIRGCVASPTEQLRTPFDTLIWSRGGILTAGTAAADTPARAAQELATRVLYWLDDDLAKYTGQMVELRGEIGELKKGELEIDRDGDFTEIRLELGGDEETIRVPTSWLERESVGPASRNADRVDDVEIDIATRKVDVDEVKVLGRCPGR